MNDLDRFRPVPQPLDPAWSTATLERILADRESPAPRRPAVRRFGAAAVAATAAGVVAVTASLGSSPAFAVEQRDNGDVVVTVRRLVDAAGLERALGERGIDTDVTYVRVAVPSDLDDGSSRCVGPSSPGDVTVDAEDAGTRIAFTRAYLDSHRGATLDLTAAGGRSSEDWIGVRLVWSDGRC